MKKTNFRFYYAIYFAIALLTCSLATMSLHATTTGRVKVTPTSLGTKISFWGYDIKQGGKATGLTNTVANEIFNTIGMNVLRVPIYAATAHPGPGQVDGSKYTDIIAAINRAKAAKSTIKVYTNLKLEGENTFPSWVKNTDGTVKNDEYATLLFDHLNYMKSQGIQFDYIGPDCEREWNKGGITASKHKNIVDNLKTKCTAGGVNCPLIMGPNGYNPSASWLNDLYNGGWFGRIDVATNHFYNKFWNSTYSSKLKDFAVAARTKSWWNTEYHWDLLSYGGEIDRAEMSFILAFDQFDNKCVGNVWWDFKRASLGTLISKMQTNMTKNTINAYPVYCDDHDGVPLAKGSLVTRAFKQGSNIFIYVINNTANSYSNKWFEITDKTISPAPTFTRWTSNGEATGTCNIVQSLGCFSYTIPAYSISCIKVTNM